MKHPNTASDYLARALRHDRAGREAQAVPDYEKALKLGLNPADERTALICLASSHRNLHQLDQAQTVINRARRKHPHDPVIEAFTALILLDAGHPRRAVRILGLALCNYATPGTLTGFDTALISKFRGTTQATRSNGRNHPDPRSAD
jgi:tetratricopeptide (TPR) repeat protein